MSYFSNIVTETTMKLRVKNLKMSKPVMKLFNHNTLNSDQNPISLKE
jgi:hypothetical protein